MSTAPHPGQVGWWPRPQAGDSLDQHCIGGPSLQTRLRPNFSVKLARGRGTSPEVPIRRALRQPRSSLMLCGYEVW